MSELIITRGVPASGKSTWAEEWVKADPENRVRVNLDDLRFEMFGSYVLLDANGGHDRGREDLVRRESMKRLSEALRQDKKAVFDTTNLTLKNFNKFQSLLIEYKKRTGKDLIVRTEDFSVTFDEAIRRNSLRDRKVPEKVMHEMFRKLGPKGEFRHIDGTYETRDFQRPSDRVQAICFDMDGTLVDVRDVRHYVDVPKGQSRNFDSFHRFSLHSPENPLVVEALREAHKRGYKIVITTARQEQYREVSQKWLDDREIPFDNMFMRSNKDMRPDYVVKNEMLHKWVLPHYDVIRCVDDNPQAVQAWVENGLSVTTVPFVDRSNSHLYEGKELPISAKLFTEGVCVRCDSNIPEGVIDPECALVKEWESVS